MVKRYSDEALAEKAAFYEAHGAVKLEGLIEPEWVDKILSTIDEMAANADEPRDPASAFSYGKAEGRMTIRYMWQKTPVVRDFLLRAELAEPIARIIGSKSLRFWFDLTFIHQGGNSASAGAGTPWHHDIAAFAFKGEHVPSLWMAMTPSDAQRSRLMFIDGSHKTSPGFYRTPDHVRPADGSSDGYLDVPDFDAMVASGEHKILTWDCAPGDALIIHPYTVHGAHGNTGAHGRRVAITTRWLGDDVRFMPTTSFEAAQRRPFIRESNLAMGGRPQGEYFPMVYETAAS